jgi:hypothetical protein
VRPQFSPSIGVAEKGLILSPVSTGLLVSAELRTQVARPPESGLPSDGLAPTESETPFRKTPERRTLKWGDVCGKGGVTSERARRH